MDLSKDKLVEFNEQLQRVALENFEYFCSIANVDLDQAYVCMQRKKGKSYTQIGRVLRMSKQAVFDRAKKCK